MALNVDPQAARRERNDRLTLVAPGTPMGKYMRCFWHPVATVAELGGKPMKAANR
jgi:5,5'-dehydrodivanillate O-demethylase oxygenase subunit